MKDLARWLLPVPGERGPITVAGAFVLLAAVVVAGATLAAWDAREGDAVLALVVAIAGLAAGCGALAGYVVWLRRAVCGRMAVLARTVLAAPEPAMRLRPAARAVVRPDGSGTPLISNAELSLARGPRSVAVPR